VLNNQNGGLTVENNGWMPCMNCMMNMQPMMQEPMMMEPMMQEPMMDMEEENLKMMYPKIYVKLMPMVKHHCDKHEEMHGTTHCPKHEHIEDMCDKIYKKVESELDDECGDDNDDDDNDNDTRQRRYGRRRAIKDFIGVLLLNELIGRRRRRRRRPRPRPHYGWY
jgi:hypothetical protein